MLAILRLDKLHEQIGDFALDFRARLHLVVLLKVNANYVVLIHGLLPNHELLHIFVVTLTAFLLPRLFIVWRQRLQQLVHAFLLFFGSPTRLLFVLTPLLTLLILRVLFEIIFALRGSCS